MEKVRLTVRRYLLLLLVTALPAAVSATDGRIEYVEGEVWLFRDGEQLVADFGDSVMLSDRIATGPAATVIVRINEASQVKLRENTTVVVNEIDGTGEVELRSGGVFAHVVRTTASLTSRRSSFRVRTPTVVAGVRGTQFFVAYGRTIEDAPDLWLCVNEGSVEVSIPETGQTTLVEEGEGINILASRRATDPRFYEWTTDLNWNFNPAAGDVADTTDLEGAYSDLLDQDYD
jgi:hypothetical protein